MCKRSRRTSTQFPYRRIARQHDVRKRFFHPLAKQNLNGVKIARLPIDLRDFGATYRVRAVGAPKSHLDTFLILTGNNVRSAFLWSSLFDAGFARHGRG